MWSCKMISVGFLCFIVSFLIFFDESEDAILAELIRTEGDVRAATVLKDTETFF